MQPDWEYVKKTTLWQYEELIKKFEVHQKYPAIWQATNQNMNQADSLARQMFPEATPETGEYPARVLATIKRLKSAGIRDWGDLLSKIPTRVECAGFAYRHNIYFKEFIDLLNYLLRWAFPFQTAARELLNPESPQETKAYEALKLNKLMNSFDILERGRTSEGRHTLADLTGLSVEFVTKLAHRADVVRLPYVRRKTLLPLCGAGYDTLAKIAGGDLGKMDFDMEVYFREVLGKKWKNYKQVIVFRILVACARALPAIMEG